MSYITLNADDSQFLIIPPAEPIGDYRRLYVNDASDDILEQVSTIAGGISVIIAINGIFDLTVKEQRMIYAVDQPKGSQSANFDALFNLVLLAPQATATFTWPGSQLLHSRNMFKGNGVEVVEGEFSEQGDLQAILCK